MAKPKTIRCPEGTSLFSSFDIRRKAEFLILFKNFNFQPIKTI